MEESPPPPPFVVVIVREKQKQSKLRTSLTGRGGGYKNVSSEFFFPRSRFSVSDTAISLPSTLPTRSSFSHIPSLAYFFMLSLRVVLMNCFCCSIDAFSISQFFHPSSASLFPSSAFTLLCQYRLLYSFFSLGFHGVCKTENRSLRSGVCHRLGSLSTPRTTPLRNCHFWDTDNEVKGNRKHVTKGVHQWQQPKDILTRSDVARFLSHSKQMSSFPVNASHHSPAALRLRVHHEDFQESLCSSLLLRCCLSMQKALESASHRSGCFLLAWNFFCASLLACLRRAYSSGSAFTFR